MRRRARRGEGGSTLIEVMVATTILIVAAMGFAGTSQYAATSTRIAHRRTAATFVRSEIADRLVVLPRSVLRTIAAANETTWLVWACYDETMHRMEPLNASWATAFECPAGAQYRSWLRVTDNGLDAWAPTTSAWRVGVYVERIDPGCTPELRDASINCVSVDLAVTD